MPALRCPSCGSHDLSQVAPSEYRCSYCGTRFVLALAASAPLSPLSDVVIVNVGPMQLNVIKALREATRLELAAAKRATDKVPSVVVHGVTAEETRHIQARLEQAGASVEIRPAGPE